MRRFDLEAKKYFSSPFLRLPVLGGFIFDADGSLKTLGLPNAPLDDTAVNIISYALTFFGLASVIMFLWGGAMYLTSGGNTQRVDRAKNIIRYAIIGMALVILSYSITAFWYTAINDASQPAPANPGGGS